jgi:phosphoribosylanthranilate isomerase
VLLEAPGRGGRGVPADWARAAAVARERTLVLAGGLTPENVGDAIRTVRPYAVDVSSGVESSAGVKDPARIARFVEEVRRAGEGLDGGDATWSRVLGC